jgi:hypothetical protein
LVVKIKGPSAREWLQLTLIRVLAWFLRLVDSLFDVRWGEGMLAHLAGGWERQISKLDADIARLEQERHELQMQAEALAIHAAALYLGGRSLARQELRFDPADPKDEEMLDASIDLLVKQRLAAIETEEIEAGHYIYHLEPNWPAISARLGSAAEQAEATGQAAAADGVTPEIADWFREGQKFIDEAFLSQTDP